MSGDLEKVTRIKEGLESARREVDRARGALDSTLSRIKEDFGCKTLEEAEKKLRELREEREKREKSLTRHVEDFEKKWGDILR